VADGTIGFVGVGTMGWPMATNLATAGYQLVVRDANAVQQSRFVAEHGGTPADQAVAFAGVDLVVTMLPTGVIVRDVVLEWDGGIASALAQGTVVVDMSSSDPLGTRQLGAALAERGIALVDAPVSGALPRARAGTLTIMIGGDDENAIVRAEPVLQVMGERLFRTGSLGTGHAMKALNNYVAATSFASAAEAVIVGHRFGLDPRVMMEVINHSTGRSFNTELTIPEEVLTRRFGTGFALGLMAKDVGIAADLADAMNVEAPVSRLMRRMWSEALAEVGPTPDFTEAVTHWERVNETDLPKSDE
jgi:3-hydroxyisobutyrate dehydrogenase